MAAARFLHLLPLTAAAVLASTAAPAQEGRGRLLTFGIEQSISWADNPGLAIPSEGTRLRADTRLTFGAVLEGPRDLLTFDSSLLLRGEDSGSGFDFGLQNPAAELRYTRSGATSSFTASVFLRESDLAEGLALSEDNATPILVLEDGSARSTGARLAYNFGEGGPFGGTLRAGLTNTDYRDTTDPDLVDNRTITAGVGLRFALNEVTEATLDIDHRLYDEAGAAPTESSTTVAAGLVRALPRGSLRGTLSTTFDAGGSRTGLSLGRSIDLPNGALSLDLGLTQSEGGTDVTGAVAYQQDLPRGGLSARLSRAVTTDAGNDETLVTALSLGLTQELTPRMGLNLGADWSRSEDTGSGIVTDNASLNASLNYALTQDWTLNAGANHRVRDEDGIGRASSNSVFLSVGRTFEFRP